MLLFRQLVFGCILFVAASLAGPQRLDPTLVRLHAVLLPRTVLLDYDFGSKLINQKIVITVYYQKEMRQDAEFFEYAVGAAYPSGVIGYQIEVALQEYGKGCGPLSTAIFLLPTKSGDIQEYAKCAAQDGILSFAYNSGDLGYGAAVSLLVGEHTRPLVNLDALSSSKLQMRGALLKMGKIYKGYPGTKNIDSRE